MNHTQINLKFQCYLYNRWINTCRVKQSKKWWMNGSSMKLKVWKTFFFFLVPYNLEQVLGSLWVYKITSFDHDYGTIDFTDFKRKYFFLALKLMSWRFEHIKYGKLKSLKYGKLIELEKNKILMAIIKIKIQKFTKIDPIIVDYYSTIF